MKQPRICLTTWFDAPYAKMGALCLSSLKEYGKRNGYDVVILNEISSQRPSSWNKIPAIEALFKKGYDFVFWIDADAVITRYDVLIETEIKSEKDLYFVNFKPSGGGEIPNFGIFLIRNSEWSKQFLKKIWGMTEYTHNPCWENSAVVAEAGLAGNLPDELKKYMPPEELKKKPNQDFLSHVQWIGNEWNWVARKDIIYLKKPIIQHYPSWPLPMREWHMSRTLRNNKMVSIWSALFFSVRAVPWRIRIVSSMVKNAVIAFLQKQ